MTLAQLRAETQQRAGDSSLTSTSIDLWLNLGIKQISRRADWPWNIATKSSDTTTASTVEITLPTDFQRMISVRVGSSASGTEPDATEYSFVDYTEKNVSTSGDFFYVNHSTNKYGLIPTPATTGLPVFLKYFKVPADISDSNTTIPIPEPYHEVLIFCALKKFWEVSDDGEKVLFYNAEFENMIERMKQDLLSPASGKLARVKDIRELVGRSEPRAINSVGQGR